MNRSFITSTIALFCLAIASGCTNHLQPVSIDQLANSKSEPTGGVALTLIPVPSAADNLRTFVEITLKDQNKKETMLRIDAPDITAKTAPNGAPFLFNIKPGRYAVSLFAIRTYEQEVNGRKYSSGYTTHIPNKSVMFFVNENSVVHIGTFSYSQTATPFEHGFRLKGDLNVTNEKPSEDLWKPIHVSKPGLKFEYLAPKETWLEALTWQY